MMRSTIVVFFALIANMTAMDLPSNIKLCDVKDPNRLKCVANSVREAVISLANGLKSFNILPIDPMEINSLNIGENIGSVALKQEYRNIKMYGLTKNLEIYNQQIDDDKHILRTESLTPQLNLISDYKVQGNILLLPIHGEGKSNITFLDLKTRHHIDIETFKKDDGETYYRIKKYTIKLFPKQLIVYFDNLFNGDPAFGAQMNKFLNANWNVIFKEFEKPFEEVFNTIFGQISNNILTRIPARKIPLFIDQ